MFFYTYAYLRSKDSPSGKVGTPYYQGKGCGDRAYMKHKGIPVPKDRKYIIIQESNLTELGAFALERRYIRWYGRKDNGTGILLNRTDGGEGSSGYRHTDEQRKSASIRNIGKKLSIETINKISISKSGDNCTLETRKRLSESKRGDKNPKNMLGRFGENNPLYGTNHSEETKIKMSKAKIGKPPPMLNKKHDINTIEKMRKSQLGDKNHNFGKTASDETRKKMSDSMTGKKQPILQCPYCPKSGGVSAMRRYHFDNCKEK